MRKTKVSQFLGCGLLLSTSCLAQEPKTRSAPIDTAVMEALQQSGSAAGIEVNLGCGDVPQVRYQITTGDPEMSLQNIHRADKMTLSWSKKPRSAYRVLIDEKPFSSQLPSITVPERVIEAASLNYAVDVLLHDPLVRSQLTKYHFEELPTQLGFTSILEGKNRSITIPAGPLDDALDAIAQSFGPAVWEITERTCGGRKTFRVDWVVR